MLPEPTPNHIKYGKWSLINYRPDEIELLASAITVPSKVQRFLSSLYTSYPQYPPVAIFKFLLLFTISTFKHLTSFYRWALNHPQFLRDLGFRESYDVLVPSYKTFWHFMHIRIGKEKIHELFSVTIQAVLPVIRKAHKNQNIGTRAILDATPLTATTHDSEASYNGHYEKYCYLWHRLICADTGIPLQFSVTTGSIHEGHIGPALVLRARLNNVNIKELWFDMKYAFGEALATYWLLGITTHYRISASWNVSQNYSWSTLQCVYYKLWKNDAYRINASYNYVLKFLALHGYLRDVGIHLRNLRIDEYLEASDSYIEEVSLRSGIEASNGYAKRNSGIKEREFRGLKHVLAHVGFYEVGRLILAYSRCREGVNGVATNKIGS